MLIDDNLLARGITWSNVTDQATDYMDGRFFSENKTYNLSFTIEPSATGYRRIPMESYRVRSFMDWQQSRVSGSLIEFEDAVEVFPDDILPGSGLYFNHGKGFLVKTQAAMYIANIKLIGAIVSNLKPAIETELKNFYLALYDAQADRIYATMTRVKDSYKNTAQENSFDTTVKKRSYTKLKYNRI